MNIPLFIIIISAISFSDALASKLGGTIMIRNESNDIILNECRASNFIPFTAREIKESDSLSENIYYFSELYDRMSFNKNDDKAKLWANYYKPVLRSCGIDNKQLCDDPNFYKNIYVRDGLSIHGAGYNKLFTSTRPGYMTSVVDLESVIKTFMVPVYYKGEQKKLYDAASIKKVDTAILKRHNPRHNHVGYDNFLGEIAKGGSFSQSYDRLWSKSAINGVYSNVECNIVDKKTHKQMGIIGATINVYNNIPVTTVFLSGNDARKNLTSITVNRIFGPYGYTKIQLIDRITKNKGTIK